MKLHYRADIDGLRAIAVLAVLLNHAGIRYFPGGFIGVDIFFVISGYLITTIIVREIDTNEFSLVTFYERRIRRIYPALFAVLLFTTITSAVLYDSYIFEDFSKSLIATTFFISNIYFWTQTGYFEGDTTLKPLLHTWSLAVEEQYYILFPLLVMLISRYFKAKRFQILAAIAFISFGWNIYALQHNSSSAFYFAHLRAWELLIGSLLALNPFSTNPKPLLRNMISLVGFGMLSIPIFVYSKDTLFPGIAAAIPALGSAMIIYSGITNSTVVNKVLSIPALVFIGQISYSLYLWHWPLINFTKQYFIQKLDRAELLLLLIITIALSTLSWKFIERPFRVKNQIGRSSVFLSAATVMVVAVMVGFVISFNNGFSNLQNDEPNPYEDLVGIYEVCNFTNPDNVDLTLEFCPLGVKSQPSSFLVWGDSHAAALATGISLSASQNGVTGQMIYGAGCPPILDIAQNKKSPCIDFNNYTFQYIKDHPELKTIILVARWAAWAEGSGYKEKTTLKLIDLSSESSKGSTNAFLLQIGLSKTVDGLLAAGRNVVIVSQVPEVKFNVPSSNFIALRTGRDVNDIIAPSWDEYLGRNQKVIRMFDEMQEIFDIQVIYPSDVLCNTIQCLVAIGETPLYADDNHLSLFGSEYISQIYNKIFEELTQNND